MGYFSDAIVRSYDDKQRPPSFAPPRKHKIELVHPNVACSHCGERRKARLAWRWLNNDEDARVHCKSCRHTYDPFCEVANA